MVELTAIILKEGEKVVAVSIPEEGKMSVEDIANLLNVSVLSVKTVVNNNNIKYHLIGRKWVVDLKDLWLKTERYYRGKV